MGQIGTRVSSIARVAVFYILFFAVVVEGERWTTLNIAGLPFSIGRQPSLERRCVHVCMTSNVLERKTHSTEAYYYYYSAGEESSK
jgi:hypothetical protein